jgi:hypothetical protein
VCAIEPGFGTKNGPVRRGAAGAERQGECEQAGRSHEPAPRVPTRMLADAVALVGTSAVVVGLSRSPQMQQLLQLPFTGASRLSRAP